MKCVSCDTTLVGEYCHLCGERTVDEAEFRVPGFLRRMAAGTFDLDSRLWRTYRTLFRHPGMLTAEYMRGRRQPYLSPLQTFLIANVLFFASLGTIGGFNAFTTKLSYHQSQPFYGAAAKRAVDREVTTGTNEETTFYERFDEASPRYANSLLILMVPLFALTLALQFSGSRRFFVQHLVFAMHFMAVVLLVAAVLPIFFSILILIGPIRTLLTTGGETPVTLVLVSIFWSHLTFAFRRAYDSSIGAAIVRGAVATVSIAPAVLVYRAILFFTVYYALRS